MDPPVKMYEVWLTQGQHSHEVIPADEVIAWVEKRLAGLGTFERIVVRPSYETREEHER